MAVGRDGRRRGLWRNLVAGTLVLAGLGAAGVVLLDVRSSSTPESDATAAKPERRRSCQRPAGLSPEQIQNCELIGSLGGVENLGAPDVRGMRFTDAHDLLQRRGIEFEFLRAYNRPFDLSDWLVCYQGSGRNWDTGVSVLRLVVTHRCPETLPRIPQTTVAAVERQLDGMNIRHGYLDAADDDFPESPEGVTDAWIVCGQTNVGRDLTQWITGFGATDYENGDDLVVDLHVAPTAAGCHASNEAEERG